MDTVVSSLDQGAVSQADAPVLEVPHVSIECVLFSVHQQRLQVCLLRPDAIKHQALPSLLSLTIDVMQDKNIEQSIRRVLCAQYNLEIPFLEQVKTLGNYRRDERGWSISIVYFALMPYARLHSLLQAVPALRCMPVHNIQALSLDHHAILQSAVKRLRNKAYYTSLPVYFLPDEFTLSEMQQVYEVVLARQLEKKAFRRRIAEAQLIVPVGRLRHGKNRPAKLYRLKPNLHVHYFDRTMRGGHPLER